MLFSIKSPFFIIFCDLLGFRRLNCRISLLS